MKAFVKWWNLVDHRYRDSFSKGGSGGVADSFLFIIDSMFTLGVTHGTRPRHVVSPSTGSYNHTAPFFAKKKSHTSCSPYICHPYWHLKDPEHWGVKNHAGFISVWDSWDIVSVWKDKDLEVWRSWFSLPGLFSSAVSWKNATFMTSNFSPD